MKSPAIVCSRDEELRALWIGLTDHPGRAADALRLRLLTGQRGEHEIAPMTWAEVDMDARLWLIPKARTKNGRGARGAAQRLRPCKCSSGRRREVSEDETARVSLP